MKSAIEIALEKTKDIKPEDDAGELSKEAKEKIREINKEYDAQVAELEINVSTKIREMTQQYGPEEVKAHAQEISGQFRTEKDRINAERREKTEAIRAQFEKKK